MPRIKLKDDTDHPCNNTLRLFVKTYKDPQVHGLVLQQAGQESQMQVRVLGLKFQKNITSSQAKIRYTLVARRIISRYLRTIWLVFLMAHVNVHVVKVN